MKLSTILKYSKGWQCRRPLTCRQTARRILSQRNLSSQSVQELGGLVKTNTKKRVTEDRFDGPKRCPSCGQLSFRESVFRRHVERCCPDLLPSTSYNSIFEEEEKLEEWLKTAREKELSLHQKALTIAFRQVNQSGQRIRQGPVQIAQQCDVPVERASRLLKDAMKAVPLAADFEPIEIIYEDEWIFALNKPPNLITAPKHRYTGGSLVNRVIGNLKMEPFVIHRLDMNTTGVVLFAKERGVASKLHAMFRNKVPVKSYLALVAGKPHNHSFIVDAPIGRNPTEKVARCVEPLGKPAITDFRVLSSTSADLTAFNPSSCADDSTARLIDEGLCSLVECVPRTGRTHQIRVHLAHIGHPIVGDDLYGLRGPCIERHALHASKLSLPHPVTGRDLTISATLPDDFAQALLSFGLTFPYDLSPH